MTKQIVIKKIKALQNHFKNFKSIDELIRKDSRGVLFSLEGILRLYLRYAPLSKHEEQIFNQAFNFTKKIEDYLGEVFFHQEALHYYEKTTCSNLRKLESKKKQEFKKLEKYLKSQKFKNELETTFTSLSKIKFKKETFIIKSIKKEIIRIDKKINHNLSDLIFKKQYTHHEIEEGVHEWRRMIRWVALYLQSHSHLFKLKIKTKHKNHNLVKKYKHNQFCILGNGRYVINAKNYYELSDYIVKVGDLKTKAEIAWFLNNQYKVNIPVPNIEPEAQQLLKQFQKSKLLKKIKKQLQVNN